MECLTKNKETIREQIKAKFIISLRKSNCNNIRTIFNKNNDLPQESKNLINQSYMTIKMFKV